MPEYAPAHLQGLIYCPDCRGDREVRSVRTSPRRDLDGNLITIFVFACGHSTAV